MVRRLPWLALVGVFVAAAPADAAPPPAAPTAVVWGLSPLPAIDFAFLLNRITIPLGTVPVID